MKRLFLFFVLVACLVVPSSAAYMGFIFYDPEDITENIDVLGVSVVDGAVDYNSAAENRIITKAVIELNAGESSNFTLYYGDTSITGYAQYTRDAVKSTIDWSLGGYSDTFYEDYGLGWMPAGSKIITLTYGADQSDAHNCSGILMTRSSNPYNLLATQYHYPVSGLLNTPFYSFSLTASDDIGVDIYTADYEIFVESVEFSTFEEGHAESYLDQLLGFLSIGFTLICEIIYWFKFIFIDNFVLTFSLIEAVILFRASEKAYKRRDPLRFFEEMFKQNKKLVDGIIGFFTGIVTIIYRVIDAIKPI